MVAAGAPTPEVAAYDAIGPLAARRARPAGPARRPRRAGRGPPLAGAALAGRRARRPGLHDRGDGRARAARRPRRPGRARTGRRDARRPRRGGPRRSSPATRPTPSRCRCCSRRSATSAPSIPPPASTTPATSRAASTRSASAPCGPGCRSASRSSPLDGLAELREQGRAVAAESAVEALSRHVADRLRTMDVGCRVGPDELAAILPEVEGLDALRVGERLRASLGAVAGLEGGFTLSIGVASFPSQAGRPESLEQHARAALEWARAHGGDRTFLYHADTAAILRSQEREQVADDEAVLTTVAAIAASIDARHPSTVFHSENVGRDLGPDRRRDRPAARPRRGRPRRRPAARRRQDRHQRRRRGRGRARSPRPRSRSCGATPRSGSGCSPAAVSRRSRPGCSTTTSASTARATRPGWSARRSPSRPASSRSRTPSTASPAAARRAPRAPLAEAMTDLERRSGERVRPRSRRRPACPGGPRLRRRHTTGLKEDPCPRPPPSPSTRPRPRRPRRARASRRGSSPRPPSASPRPRPS